MKNPQKLIEELQDYTKLLNRLRGVDEKVFTTPIGEGKWSIRDIVVHIMMWDKDCVDKTLSKLNRGEDVLLEEDVDPLSFNNRAVEYGRTLSKKDVIDQSLLHRTELTSQLSRLPAEAFDAMSKKFYSMTLSTFLEKLFISHDQHHKEQIDAFLSRQTDAKK